MVSKFAAMVVVAATVAATTVELPPCTDPFQPFVYSGCFAPAEGDSPLIFRSSEDQNDMSVEECVQICKGNSYRYAGLTYYGVCYCGQTVDGPQVEEDQCNFPCTANADQICGGDEVFSIYQDPSFLPIDETPDYSLIGCWTDDSDLGRALVFRQDDVDSATMTTETCLAACHEGGYPFAGTEYGGECYCGVVIGNGTAAADASECAMPCNGNADEICGGPARLSLYVSNELQSLEPCGTEPEPSSTPTPTEPPMCTETVVVPPKCEYKCGNWCAEELPDWDDQSGCKKGHSSCSAQANACFRHAGWPGVSDCWDFASWCGDLGSECGNRDKCKGGKKGFFGRHTPKGHEGPTTTTTVVPCETATATPEPTTEPPVPTETSICKQPSSWFWKYSPDAPVGGIELPVVTCNNIEEEFSQYPFKMYTEGKSKQCPKFSRHYAPGACDEACKEQHTECVNVYAEGCRTGGNGGHRKRSGGSALDMDKRTWRWSESYSVAKAKCDAQYLDCKIENKNVKVDGQCTTYHV